MPAPRPLNLGEPVDLDTIAALPNDRRKNRYHNIVPQLPANGTACELHGFNPRSVSSARRAAANAGVELIVKAGRVFARRMPANADPSVPPLPTPLEFRRLNGPRRLRAFREVDARLGGDTQSVATALGVTLSDVQRLRVQAMEVAS